MLYKSLLCTGTLRKDDLASSQLLGFQETDIFTDKRLVWSIQTSRVANVGLSWPGMRDASLPPVSLSDTTPKYGSEDLTETTTESG